MYGTVLTVPDSGDGEQPPPEAVHEAPLVDGVLLLGEVDEAGEGEHHHEDEREEEPELPAGAPDGVEERLEAGEVAHQLEDPQHLGDPHQPDDLAGLADDVELGDDVVEDDVDEVGEDGEQVDEVHGLHEELGLLRRARQANHVLDGEVHGREVVHVQDDLGRGLALLRLRGDVQLGVRAAKERGQGIEGGEEQKTGALVGRRSGTESSINCFCGGGTDCGRPRLSRQKFSFSLFLYVFTLGCDRSRYEDGDNKLGDGRKEKRKKSKVEREKRKERERGKEGGESASCR